MPDVKDQVIGLALGRWRNQTLYAGIGLGVGSALGDFAKRAVEIVDQLELGRCWMCRRLRALGSLEMLEEPSERRFSLPATSGVADRRPVAADDASETVAGVYGSLMTVIPHGCNGDAGREMRSMIRNPTPVDAQLFVREHAVAYPETPCLGESFDGTNTTHD